MCHGFISISPASLNRYRFTCTFISFHHWICNMHNAVIVIVRHCFVLITKLAITVTSDQKVPHYTFNFINVSKTKTLTVADKNLRIGVKRSWCHSLAVQSPEQLRKTSLANGDHWSLYTGPWKTKVRQTDGLYGESCRICTYVPTPSVLF